MVRISTLVGDPLATIWRAASSPFNEGMLMSRMLTSGFNCFGFFYSFFAIGRFAHDFPAWLLLDKIAKASAHDVMVICYQHVEFGHSCLQVAGGRYARPIS